MAWNEPGRGGRDPWGGRGGGGRGGPPDLEEWLRRLRKWLGGGKSGPYGIAIVIAILICAWLISGFYEVGSSQKGLVTRFGAYAYTADPGLHWHLPYPVAQVIKVDVDTPESVSNRAVLLTRDGQLVDVFVAAKYRVSDPLAYAFHVSDPEETLRQVLRSDMRRVIGQHKMADVLGKERNKMADRIQSLMQATLKQYGAGLTVSAVSIQDAKPPKAVAGAFKDVAKAHSDSSSDISKAKAYASSVLPKAHGAATQQMQQAQSYKTQVVDHAKGQVARFMKVWQAYQRYPEGVREHLYFSTLEQMVSHSSNVLLDAGKGQAHIEIAPFAHARPQPSSKGKSAKSGKKDAGGKSSSGDSAQQVPPPPLQSSGSLSEGADGLLRSRARGER